MTVEKGSAWGEPVIDPPPDLVSASSDADLARLAAAGLQADSRLVARVQGGDLLRTLGLDHPRSDESLHRYSMDLGLAVLDGHSADPRPFAAHLVARGRFWSGTSAVVMNAALLGDLRLGPKAHPNDGLLDVTTGHLPMAQRWEARRRARSGAHLPHPTLSTQRVPSWCVELPKNTGVWLDGVRFGSARSIEVQVVPDAFFLVA